jgi:hypothetical protein
MVDTLISNIGDHMPAGIADDVYHLQTPELQLDRAVSDYLYLSRNRERLYPHDDDYLTAEEAAWDKLQEALAEHPEFNINK